MNNSNEQNRDIGRIIKLKNLYKTQLIECIDKLKIRDKTIKKLKDEIAELKKTNGGK